MDGVDVAKGEIDDVRDAVELLELVRVLVGVWVVVGVGVRSGAW